MLNFVAFPSSGTFVGPSTTPRPSSILPSPPQNPVVDLSRNVVKKGLLVSHVLDLFASLIKGERKVV